MHTRIQGESLSPSTINRWIAASQQINLGVPMHRRRHRQARTRAVVLVVGCCVLLAGMVKMLWPQIAGLF